LVLAELWWGIWDFLRLMAALLFWVLVFVLVLGAVDPIDWVQGFGQNSYPIWD
jgi:hypothetical protein